jgi:hypothetical protein
MSKTAIEALEAPDSKAVFEANFEPFQRAFSGQIYLIKTIS